MHRTWKLDKRGIAAKSPAVGGVLSEPPDFGRFSAGKEKRRLLSFLTRNMAAAIVTAVLREEGMTSEPDADACQDE